MNVKSFVTTNDTQYYFPGSYLLKSYVDRTKCYEKLIAIFLDETNECIREKIHFFLFLKMRGMLMDVTV